jgi:hypothetical protein
MPPHTDILVVADDAGVRAFLAEGLRREGCQVLTAADVPAAEALGQRLGLESLDLVILDRQVREGGTLGRRWGAARAPLPRHSDRRRAPVRPVGAAGGVVARQAAHAGHLADGGAR